MADLEQLIAALGVEIDRELLTLAVTHSSFAYENDLPDNERLEFLGDSVLGFLVTRHLYEAHPELTEGELTKLKNAVVSAPALAAAANRLNLGAQLRLGRGEEQTQGRGKQNVLADAFEALLGAAYLSGGIAAASAIVEAQIIPQLENSDAIREMADPKTSLIERLVREGMLPPVYEITHAGPDHEREFFATVFSGERELGRGSSTTRRGAELTAAAAALRALNA
jgi:ribonuclease-3